LTLDAPNQDSNVVAIETFWPQYRPKFDFDLLQLNQVVQSLATTLTDTAPLIVSTISTANPNPGRDTFQRISADIAKGALISKVHELLNPNAAKRLKKFLNYAPGWDGPSAKAMDAGSLTSFDRLLSMLTDKNREDVGLFMSGAGHVIVNWHAADGSLVELEVEAGQIVLFKEADDSEVVLPVSKESLEKHIEL
jgi:hypothetical protein